MMRTWADLAQAILALTPEQQAQPIQCVLPTPDENDTQELVPGIALDTVGGFEFQRCRSAVDNKYNADEVVLLLDGNPFECDGAFAYQLTDEGYTPIYRDGKATPEADQCAPHISHSDSLAPYVGAIVQYRAANPEE